LGILDWFDLLQGPGDLKVTLIGKRKWCQAEEALWTKIDARTAVGLCTAGDHLMHDFWGSTGAELVPRQVAMEGKK
jgi:hypothetical protein